MNERILVLDDEQEVLRICYRALNESGRGYVVVTASTADQARAYLQEQEFDLLILDIHLPEENGLSLLKYVRKTQPDLPAMLITGYPAVNTVIDAVRMNVREYVVKPFTVRRLLEAVEASMQDDHA